MRMMRRLAVALLIALTARPVVAQGNPRGLPQSGTPLTQAARQGFPLHTDLTVKGNVTVQAVLIPAKIAGRIFGKEIGNNYAVIGLTITNKSSDAALIIQGAYIDYTDWALSGSVEPDLICREGLGEDDKGPFRACTQPNQVASEEYRIVRGELLNAQNWTKRNASVRLLTLLGSVASGYSFSIKEQGFLKGISAFGGIVVPGFATFWPDETVQQLNRISDVGFQTNKVVSKQGSDIIVCFFPIERFLTESYRKLFVNNPSVFFAPLETLVDKQVLREVMGLLPANLLPKDPEDIGKLMKQVPCYLHRLHREYQRRAGGSPTPLDAVADEACENIPDAKSIVLLETIRRMSLNTIRIVIDGVMSVETAALQAKIESVEFDNEKTNAALWTGTSKTLTGTITGAYLTGGVPKIQDADNLGIADLVAVTEGSTDQALKFSLTLNKEIRDGTQLTFFVEKTVKDASGAQKTIDSAPYEYKVQYAPVPAPAPTPQPSPSPLPPQP